MQRSATVHAADYEGVVQCEEHAGHRREQQRLGQQLHKRKIGGDAPAEVVAHFIEGLAGPEREGMAPR